jgi:arabinogalactan endo-1,4-beta-galactosidase
MKKLIPLVTFALILLACKDKSTNPNIPPPVQILPPFAWNTFCMGVDLSYANELEDYGAVYRDSSVVKDPFIILKSHGANTVRVRLWYNPQWVGVITGGKLYSDLADVEKTIGRAKALGMAVNLDIHYSDEWADAGHQSKPAAWEGLAFNVLKDSVYQYTLSVLTYLKSKGLTPEMVQVGNETNMGMLYPDGEVTANNWVPFGELLNAGIKAVRDFSAGSDVKPLIILHVAQLQNAEWWVGNIISKGMVTDFDILGISHYSKWSTVKTMQQVTSAIKKVISVSHKQVMIVETAYPWTGEDADTYVNIISTADTVTGYPATKEGQYRYCKDLTQAVINAGGKGIMYWEPDWITSSMRDKWGTGSSWDNCTLFDFSGNVLPSSSYMNFPFQF